MRFRAATMEDTARVKYREVRNDRALAENHGYGGVRGARRAMARARLPGRRVTSGRRRLLRGRPYPVAAGFACVPGDRQRRLHQPAHAGAPGLRRQHEHVPARQPGGPHRPRHPVPDQLQPRLRAPVRQHQRRPGHDGRLGHRERPPGPVQVRRSRPTRATRTGRTTRAPPPTRRRRSTRSAVRPATRCRLPAPRNCRTPTRQRTR